MWQKICMFVLEFCEGVRLDKIVFFKILPVLMPEKCGHT